MLNGSQDSRLKTVPSLVRDAFNWLEAWSKAPVFTLSYPVECILAVQDSQSQSCFHRSMLYFRDICLRASNVSQMRQNHRKQNQVSPEAHHIENHHIENQNESEAKKDRALQQADHVVVKRASGCAPGKVCIGQHALGKGGWTPVMLRTANDTCNRKVFNI
jgi:hypothetical protein